MLQRVAAVVVLLSLQVAAFAAPLTHAHLDDHETPHHDGRAVHAHWSPHAASAPLDAPGVDHPDEERPTFLQLFVAVSTSPVALAACAVAPFRLAPPPEAAATHPVTVAHAHDPPSGTPLPPRAPPAFLP